MIVLVSWAAKALKELYEWISEQDFFRVATGATGSL